MGTLIIKWKRVWNRIKILFYGVKPKGYLIKLVENLQVAQDRRRPLPFVIVSSNTSGFIVKIGGLYAHLPYRVMPWEYKLSEDWQVVSKYFIGTRFMGQVRHISTDQKPIQITISARFHNLLPKELDRFNEYKAVVVRKLRYGLFMDAGYHFNWKHGSFLGLMHKSSFGEIEGFENAQPGQILRTYFHGTTNTGKLVFGSFEFQSEWDTGELDNLIGTVQMVTVKVNKDEKMAFFVNDKYKTTIPITKAHYPKSDIKYLKEFKATLKNEDKFECIIYGISSHNHFVAKIKLDGGDMNYVGPS